MLYTANHIFIMFVKVLQNKNLSFTIWHLSLIYRLVIVRLVNMASFSNEKTEKFYNRLLEFAKRCQKLVSILPQNIANREYGIQLIRSSASPGSNYIEAVEALSLRDFIHRFKICRKESKESTHWLILIQSANNHLAEIQKEAEALIREAQEFIKIFSSSIATSEIKLKNAKISK